MRDRSPRVTKRTPPPAKGAAVGSRLDPTRTATERRVMASVIYARFRRIARLIETMVKDTNVFGLAERDGPTANADRTDVQRLLRESMFRGGEGPTEKLIDKSAAQKLTDVLFPMGRAVTLEELIDQYHKLGRRNYPDDDTWRAVNAVWAEAAAKFPREQLEELVRQGAIEFEPTRQGKIQGGSFPAYLDDATPGLTQLLRTKLDARSSDEPPLPTAVAAPASTAPIPAAVAAPAPTPTFTAPPLKEEVENPDLTAVQFDTSPNKVKRFRAWLRVQLDSDKAGDAIIQQYIDAGYRKGVTRAFDDLRKGAVGRDGALVRAGQREEYVRMAMSKGPTVEKVKLLAGRTFNDLEDVNAKMAAKMSRLLADALIQGWSAAKTAKLMSQQVGVEQSRALTIVRTELIRAHAEGQLDGLQNLGQDKVGVMVEWRTAGDNRVCPQCQKMADKVLKIDDARGMIPVHPNCRCAWVPVRERKK